MACVSVQIVLVSNLDGPQAMHLRWTASQIVLTATEASMGPSRNLMGFLYIAMLLLWICILMMQSLGYCRQAG